MSLFYLAELDVFKLKTHTNVYNIKSTSRGREGIGNIMRKGMCYVIIYRNNNKLWLLSHFCFIFHDSQLPVGDSEVTVNNMKKI